MEGERIMKKNRTQLKKVLRGSMAIAVAFALSVTPILPGESERPAAKAATDRTISGLGTNGIGSPVPGYKYDASITDVNLRTGHDTPWSGNYVYYGKYKENADNYVPMKYRVLDPRTQRFSENSNTSTMLLDCDSILTDLPFNSKYVPDDDPNLKSPKPEKTVYFNKWADSSIRTYLNGNDFLANESVFTFAENRAIASSTIGEHPYTGYGGKNHTTYGNPPNTVDFIGTVGGNFGGVYTPLSYDRIFLLDVEDLSNINYGYTNDQMGKNRFKVKLGENISTDVAQPWWTRSDQNDPVYD